MCKGRGGSGVNERAELTGWKNGLLNELLLIVPTEGTWDEALARVNGRLEEAKNNKAWHGAQITMEFGNRPVPSGELSALIERLKQAYGFTVVAVVTTDNVTREAARSLTLNAYLMLPGRSSETNRDAASGNNALYLPQTIRSGQRIVHGGHILIGGDVNPGAEVIAEGDIVIFGTLRGVAHAGSQGNENASITAGSMKPQLLRIAGQIARAPEEADKSAAGSRVPEVARIENHMIQVSPV